MCLLILLAPALSAQDSVSRNNDAAKQATAVRVEDGAIDLDGRLDEEIWQRAPAIADFIQKEPTEGAAPTELMEVRFAYDGSALYVGARMQSHNRSGIQAPLGRRDDDAQAENIVISLDTFLDRRTAYSFGVTASGVRLDRRPFTDDERTFDTGFDPVWEAKTQVDAEGWTAEFWILFSQLRFSKQAEQVWGLNVRRFIPTLNEEDYWVLIPRTVQAWASRFGTLRGIERLGPTRRIELLPFFVQSSTVNSQRDLASPFDSAYNPASHVGLDMKMGLGPGLTLQATVNPDFGQVEADPAEVNLTAYETRFAEKRPFFTEDADLMTVVIPRIGNNLFYSRRIGGHPVGPASADYVDYPPLNTILGAAKVTGHIGPRTLLASLVAVTAEESARLADIGSSETREVRVAPRTTWGLTRIQQEFGRLGSTAGLIVVGMHRELAAGDPLANLLPRTALTAAGDTRLRFKGGEYELKAVAVGTLNRGEPAAIELLQRLPMRYFQRPDKDYERLDPTRTSFPGFSMQMNFDRLSGRHWLWGLEMKNDTPAFEPNALGYLRNADGINPTWNIKYRETRPGRVLRNYSVGFTQRSEWNFGWDRQAINMVPAVNLTWSNFWTTSFSVTELLRGRSAVLTRGGPLMGTPRQRTYTATLANSATSQTRWSGTVTLRGEEDGGMTRRINGTFSFRPGSRWQLSMTPSYEYLIDTQQYVTTRGEGRPDTFGKRYIFSEIEKSTLAAQFRLNFTFKPDLNLDVYAEPFAASGRYYDYGELLVPGSRSRLAYGTEGTTIERQADRSLLVSAGNTTFSLANSDFNVRSFRSNVVLRWEWRPGSTLYLVWQQDGYANDPVGTPIGLGDMFRSITDPGRNTFLVKTSFWLPVR